MAPTPGGRSRSDAASPLLSPTLSAGSPWRRWVRRVWQSGGLVAVGIMLLVILSLTLNALVVVHNNRVHGTGTRTSAGLDQRRSAAHPERGGLARRRTAPGDQPQVRRGGSNETAPPADTPAPSKAGTSAPTRKTAGDKPPSTASTGLVEDTSFFQDRPSGTHAVASASGTTSSVGGASTPPMTAAVTARPTVPTEVPSTSSCVRQGITTTDIWLVHVPAADAYTLEVLWASKSPELVVHPRLGHASYAALLAEYTLSPVASDEQHCHLFATWLCHPVDRILTEYRAMRLRSQVAASTTNERTIPTFLDGTELGVLLRLADGALSLADYVQQNHTERSPNNRFVSYLTSVPIASQRDPQQLATTDAQRALDAAKKVLEAMPWFGLHEHVSDSLFLLQRQLGMRPDPLRWTSLLAAEEDGSHKDLPAEVAALVEKHNRLDMELYQHAHKVFTQRVLAARAAAGITSPVRYTCGQPDCSTETNERIRTIATYPSVSAAPWMTLCQRDCTST